jgi:hypothetical protein
MEETKTGAVLQRETKLKIFGPDAYFQQRTSKRALDKTRERVVSLWELGSFPQRHIPPK